VSVTYQLRIWTASELLDRKERWKANASRAHFGGCAVCGRTMDDDGRPLLVARQERARRFLCLRCWLEQPRRRAA
jgi:hypothetical protein